MSLWWCPTCEHVTGPTWQCGTCGGACERAELEQSPSHELTSYLGNNQLGFGADKQRVIQLECELQVQKQIVASLQEQNCAKDRIIEDLKGDIVCLQVRIHCD